MVDATLIQFARELAEAARTVVRALFRSHLAVDTKSDDSPVTQADRDAEAAMRQLIETRYPDHGVLGEEYGESNAGAAYRWILDPIDGTKSFILGLPVFATLIALEYEGRPILGVIDQPILDQYLIGDGEQTLLNGEAVRVRPCADPGEAFLLTPDHYAIEQYQDAAAYDRLARAVKCYRCTGDGYAHGLVASGFADIALDPVMNIWDLHALIPVVQGAGGVMTDWAGNDPVGGTSAVAAGPDLHDRVLDILHGGA